MNKNNNGRSATITDVARRAGVSIKTVSRVMNNEPNVKDATKEKVQKAALALNYEPNMSARMLAGSKSFSIALIYENPHEFSYLKRVLDGVFDACGRAGYSLLLKPCLYPHENFLNDVQVFLKQTRIDGLILTAPLGDDEELTALLEDQGIPFALIAPRQHKAEAIVVKCDDELATRTMTEHIISLGHRRIGFIKGHPDHAATDLRLNGYKVALKQHGLKYDTKLVRQGYFDFESGQSTCKRMLTLKNPPTAIIASNDDMAAGANYAARELGFDVPADVSITGFDDTPTASQLWPPLTTVKQPITQMAEFITYQLIAAIRNEEPAADTGTFQCALVLRSSTAPPKD